jgi:predicted adenylyl cyclase CyaB
MPNIEIKARCADSKKAKSIAASLQAKHVGTDRQIDTYFKTGAGRLKLRESSLSGAQLIPYVRPDVAGPKKSDYTLIPVPDPSLCKKLLSDILGVETVVDKIREIYLIGNVRVHIDSVQELGHFIEFEAVYRDAEDETTERAKVEVLMAEFHISSADLLTGSYRELSLGVFL